MAAKREAKAQGRKQSFGAVTKAICWGERALNHFKDGTAVQAQSGASTLHRHRSLPTADHIRVMDIESAVKSGNIIRCRLRTCSLENPRPYMTLSYVWGEQKPDGSHLTQVIECDDQLFRVTSTLHSALLRIREKMDNGRITGQSRERLNLWVDAICINQDDAEERGQQVTRMGIIYHLSCVLIIWLGECTGEEQIVLQHLFSQWNKWEMSSSNQELLVLEDLLRRPWFQRRWVIQEYLNASDSVRYTLCGGALVLCHSLAKALHQHNLISQAGPLELADGYYSEILDILQMFDYAQCSDARDRLYALASLQKDERGLATRTGLEADYTSDTESVYTSFAILMAKGLDLGKLLACATTRKVQNGAGRATLPSWVPDWRNPVLYTSNQHREAVEKCSNYITGSESDFFVPYNDGPCLALHGWVIRRCNCMGPGKSCNMCLMASHAYCNVQRALDQALPWGAEERMRRDIQRTLGFVHAIVSQDHGDELAVCLLESIGLAFVLRRSDVIRTHGNDVFTLERNCCLVGRIEYLPKSRVETVYLV